MSNDFAMIAGGAAGLCSLGVVLGGGLGAAFGAMGGAIGAKIMTVAGMAGYVGAEAAKMGALGSGLLGIGLGACVPCTMGLSAVGSVPALFAGSMIGYGILQNTVTMGVAQTAIAGAVGGAVVIGGISVVTCVTACVAMPCIVLASGKAKNTLGKWGLFARSGAQNDIENPAPLVGNSMSCKV